MLDVALLESERQRVDMTEVTDRAMVVKSMTVQVVSAGEQSQEIQIIAAKQ